MTRTCPRKELLEAAIEAAEELEQLEISADAEWGEARTRRQMNEQNAWSPELVRLRAAIKAVQS